jgi:hypothetical protein
MAFGTLSMKFREERPFADIEAAVEKLLEIANGMAAPTHGFGVRPLGPSRFLKRNRPSAGQLH